MRLGIKGKQVLGVTSIVGMVVVILSLVHLSRLASVSLEESRSRAELLAKAIFHRAREVVHDGADPYNALRADPGLRSILESSLYSKNVMFAAIVDVPDGAVELDYLIGDAARRGRGLGARMIATVVENIWCAYPAAAAVLVAVVAANTASWRALEKAGLRRIAEGAMSPDNPADDPLHFVYRVDRPQD